MKNRVTAAFLFLASVSFAFATTPEDELLEAIRASDVAAVKKLLDGGVSANAKYRYDRSALSFAADRGNVEIVKMLLDRGANVDAKDTYYKMTPLSGAAMKGNLEILALLLPKSASGVGGAFLTGIFAKKADVVSAVLATGKLSARDLTLGLTVAEKVGSSDAATLLRQAGAVPLPPATFTVDAARLARYAGAYRKDDEELTLSVANGVLTGSYRSTGFSSPLSAMDERRFLVSNAAGMTVDVVLDGERVTAVEVASVGAVDRFERVGEAK